jgi:hypothetical protein
MHVTGEHQAGDRQALLDARLASVRHCIKKSENSGAIEVVKIRDGFDAFIKNIQSEILIWRMNGI